jgi:hypothetical protein
MVFNTAFYESEVNREVRVFGNIAHVWSTYETSLEKDGKVERRGINRIRIIVFLTRIIVILLSLWYNLTLTLPCSKNTNVI